MPFANNGVYTPPDGSENALPGQIIRSLTWNSIHVDIATALTGLRTTYSQMAPVTTKSGNYTVSATDSSLIFNAAGTATITMPSAVTYPGRWLYTKTIAAQAVVASAAVIVPLVGGAAALSIVPATAGKYAHMQSDGTNWVIMTGN